MARIASIGVSSMSDEDGETEHRVLGGQDLTVVSEQNV
jgi:hypothetical protein